MRVQGAPPINQGDHLQLSSDETITLTNEEDPITWLRLQGHEVIKTNSSYWYDAGPKVYQAFPYHKVIIPTPVELQQLFQHSRAIAIRYSTPLCQPEGLISYHVVNKEIFNLTDIPKKVRHNVSMGLEYATYQPISMKRLAAEGWKLRADTLNRQGRKSAESKRFWERMCLSAENLNSFEAWGAFHGGELVASLFACTIDTTVCVLFQQSLTPHMKFGINNALFHEFTNTVLNRRGVTQVFYGLHSLDAPASVDQFKFRMGYVPLPVRQHVIFNPSLAAFIQPVSYYFVKMVRKIIPSSNGIAKAEGIMRFYLQGKLPLSDQVWPEALLDQKEEILSKANSK